MKAPNSIFVSMKSRIRLFSFIGTLLLILTAAFGTNAANTAKSKEALIGSPLSFSASLDSNTIGPGNISTLTYTITNNSSSPVTDIAFTVNLPASVTIAGIPNAQSDIANGTLSATANGTKITFSDGDLAGSSSGQISVDVTSSTTGIHAITSGSLTSNSGSSGTATTDLTDDTNLPSFSTNFAPSSVNQGQRATLTYTVDNTASAANIITLLFNNNLPSGMTIASPANISINGIADPQLNRNLTAMPGTNSVSFSVFGFNFPGFEIIPAGAVGTITIDVVATGIGTLDNTTSPLTVATSTNPFQPTVGKASDTLNVTADTIGIQMSFTDDPIPPGGTTNLEFTINNRDRDIAATNLAFTLDLDSVVSGAVATGLPQTGVVGAGSTISGTSIVTLSGGSVPAGGSATFSIPVQIPASATAGNFAATTSSLTGDLNGTGFTSNPASDLLFIQAAPVLEMSYTDDPISTGDVTSLEFTITNTNTTSSATDIAFNTSLPVIIPSAATVPSPVCNGGTLNFIPIFIPSGGSGQSVIPSSIALNGGTLAAGATCTFTVTLNTDANAPGGTYPTMSSDITATINTESVSGQPAADELIVITAPSLSMAFADPVVPGSTTTLDFTLQYGENASADATNIGFTVDLNSALSGLTATGLPLNDVCGTGSQASGTGLITFSGGTLSPGTSCSFSVTVQVPASAPSSSVNVATSDVTATVSGGAVSRQGANDNLDISALVTTAEFLNSPVVPGDLLILRFTIDNQSPTNDATGIFFTANLSSVLPGLVAESPLPTNPCGAGSSVSGTSFLVFVGGNVTAGTSCSFDVLVRVPAAAPIDTYQVTTSSVTATIAGNVTVLDPLVASFTLTQPLGVAVNFIEEVASSGGTPTLEFTVTNSSTSDSISNIAFTDDLNASLPGLIATGLPSNDICGIGSQLSGTSILSLTGGTLAPGASCTFSTPLQIPGGASTSVITNTTSNPTGQLNGITINGTASGDSINIINDNATPTINFTPVSNTNSTDDQVIRVSIIDDTEVTNASISFSINGNPLTTNACNLTSGTTQNGEWVCTISGLTNSSVITYFITANDLASRTATNPNAGATSPNLFTIGSVAIPSGTYSNMSLSAGSSFAGNIDVAGIFEINGIVDANGNTITLGCNASSVGAGTGSYVVGNVAKEFCSPSAFTYPVGTTPNSTLQSFVGASEFSPFTADITAVGSSPSTLTVSVTDGFLSGSGTTQSASRFWNVTETGSVTANLSFTYLNQDINGDESSYQVLRQSGGVAEVVSGGSVNATTNTASATNISTFSQWAAGNLAPTSAGVSIGGQVINSFGRGLPRARIILTDTQGNTFIRQTNPFGYYNFQDLTAGEIYIISVEDKSYSFKDNTRTIFAGEDNANVIFTATGRN